MKGFFGAIVFVILAAGLQGNLPAWLNIWGAKPDLVLVVLLAYALAADPSFGATLGFLAGLIHGGSVGLCMGSFIVTRTITGFLAGLVTTRLFSENPVVPVISATWLTFVCEMLFLFANPRPDAALAMRKVAGECILNGIFTLFVYCWLRHVESQRKLRLVNARI